MRIASFNVQNLRLRRSGGAARLDGARDRDVPADLGPGATRHDLLDRRLTAAVLRHADADVVALQEVFDTATLEHFHDRFLLPAGLAPYPHRICLPGNDGSGLDLALLSRRTPDEVTSHAALRPGDLGLAPEPGDPPFADLPVFRRDCVVVRIGRLTLFHCHFKAPYPDAEAAWPVRRLEARAVAALIARRFPDPAAALWLVLGDLNEPAMPLPGREPAVAPLRALAVDLFRRLPEDERWTYREPRSGRYSRPDALLASPALARLWPATAPVLLREGLAWEAGAPFEPRLAGIGMHRPHASDHAAVVVEFPGL